MDAKTNEQPAPDLETEEGAFVTQAMERWDEAHARERQNIDDAMDDLRFRAGEQWPDEIRAKREAEDRPCLDANLIPQFIRQITGDIRQGRPAIRVVPVDTSGDKKTGELFAGMIRYIENRSDAQAAYFTAADSQVTCGIGHWRVVTEYAEESTLNQEIRIQAIEDGVNVLWDPDSVLPTREDAMWCFVPCDMSRAAYKARFKDKAVAGVGTTREGWSGDDYVRVAEYWVKKPVMRTLAVLPDGQIDDLTALTDDERAQAVAMVEAMAAQGLPARIEDREGFQILRYLINSTEILEGPDEWPGRYIPIVPVIGEEVRIGRRVVRHGAIRYAKDPQRMFLYFLSTHTEIVALQPKAPFMGTEQNFQNHLEYWSTANIEHHPFLPYTPDPANGNVPPQRAQPPVSSQGVNDGISLAMQNMKAAIGIYDAGLGNQSNETSGRAILARQREGDVGAYVYVDNFTRAVRYTGKILVDLIPHIYDVERTIQVMGEDGALDTVRINQPETIDGAAQRIQNDVTAGAYDVVLDSGPSYSTRREEAREGITAFMQSVPDAAALVLDLFAKGQDWPMADQIAKRLRVMLPPQIQAMEAQENGEEGPQMPEQPPDPNAVFAAQKAEAETAKMQMELQSRQIDLAMKQVELRTKEIEMAMRFGVPPAQAGFGPASA